MTDGANTADATIDHGRRAMSVPRRLMPVIMAVHAGENPKAIDSITELRHAGLMTSERLDPLVTSLVDVMINPSLVVTVEVAGARSPRLATIWGTPRRAVVGMTDDRRRFDLVQIEPKLLPFHLAQTTGLSPRPHPPFSGGCSLPATALNIAEDLIATDPEEAEKTLTAAGVPEPWADRLLTALTHRISLWTVESVWLGRGAGRSQSRLSVLDAGPAGYWRFAPDGDGTRVSITVSDFDDIIRRFSALLPTPGPPPGIGSIGN
ncbi:MAG: ESX secretion-associated protein EspG [Actinomycetota bacterium]|nr:ESX secretion-associated protein EspG [Actinomycetota bacterium]